jgi:hypothetical protein
MAVGMWWGVGVQQGPVTKVAVTSRVLIMVLCFHRGVVENEIA